jgi:lysozyme
VEQNAWTLAAQLLTKHEGRRSKVYFDTVGLPTIGIGRNLAGKGLSEDEIDYLFRNDVNEAFGICSRLCPSFDTLSPNRQAALVDMAFMGEDTFAGFHQMWAAIEAKDWQKAHDEILDSKWTEDVGPTRSGDVSQLILLG